MILRNRRKSCIQDNIPIKEIWAKVSLSSILTEVTILAQTQISFIWPLSYLWLFLLFFMVIPSAHCNWSEEEKFLTDEGFREGTEKLPVRHFLSLKNQHLIQNLMKSSGWSSCIFWFWSSNLILSAIPLFQKLCQIILSIYLNKLLCFSFGIIPNKIFVDLI